MKVSCRHPATDVFENKLFLAGYIIQEQELLVCHRLPNTWTQALIATDVAFIISLIQDVYTAAIC